MDRDHFVRMGKVSTPAKAEAARRNGRSPLAGRPPDVCPVCGSIGKVLRREAGKVARVCRNCLFTRIDPGGLTSAWADWHPDRWRDFHIARRSLSSWGVGELREKQRLYWGNSAKEQGALDAALVAASGTLPTGKITSREVTAWNKSPLSRVPRK